MPKKNLHYLFIFDDNNLGMPGPAGSGNLNFRARPRDEIFNPARIFFFSPEKSKVSPESGPALPGPIDEKKSGPARLGLELAPAAGHLLQQRGGARVPKRARRARRGVHARLERACAARVARLLPQERLEPPRDARVARGGGVGGLEQARRARPRCRVRGGARRAGRTGGALDRVQRSHTKIACSSSSSKQQQQPAAAAAASSSSSSSSSTSEKDRNQSSVWVRTRASVGVRRRACLRKQTTGSIRKQEECRATTPKKKERRRTKQEKNAGK